MRKSDIAYVPNGPVHYFPAKELEEMTLDEIKRKYLKTCAKANGEPSKCSQCKTPCKEGKRAIQLLANTVYDNPPIPLYGGKTLIERAKEENMKRREAMNNELVTVTKDNFNVLADNLNAAKIEALGKADKEEKKVKKQYMKRGDWWEISLESGNQVKWLMDNMGLSKTQAKKKIYQYRYNHGLTKETKAKPVEEKPVVKAKEEPKAEEAKAENGSIEVKIEWLMHQQTKLEKEMSEYQKLYEETKEKYEKVKQKIDILCSAMDILND